MNQIQHQAMRQRYCATMVLSAVGDAMGFKNGQWEFNYNGQDIHRQMLKITNNQGPGKLVINQKDFRYSDDTVMHIATALGLIRSKPNQDGNSVCLKIAEEYVNCWKYMAGRSPGNTCLRGVQRLMNDANSWKTNNFRKNAGGCGAAMRSACIGLYYPNDIKKLIEISIESGRTTHHNPIGYLGSMVSAYFTALAIKNINPKQWLSLLFKEAFPMSKKYILHAARDVEDNLNNGDWETCINTWSKYAKIRQMSEKEVSTPIFPKEYGVKEREQFYSIIANRRWPGALGLDSVIIAYDAFLGCEGDWVELCNRAMLHGGDNDSTGAIAGAWFGAYYGYKGVTKQNMDELQNREYINKLGLDIYDIIYEQKQEVK